MGNTKITYLLTYLLDKRQCSLQVCFYPEDNNVKVGIKFRGTGKRISDEEKLTYHNAVNVYRQKSAWADIQVNVD